MKIEINGTDMTVTSETLEDNRAAEQWKDFRAKGTGRLFIKTDFAYDLEEVARNNEGLGGET